MADLTPKTINELPSASALDGTELMALSQSGSAKKAALSALMSVLYPVGSIYLSVNSTSPATLFGGTWVQIKDTFLLAAGDTYTAGTTGGEAAHTLVENELPNTKGVLLARNGSNYSDMDIIWPKADVANNAFTSEIKTDLSVAGLTVGSSVGYTELTMEFGNDQAHNNMPPYLTVYMWKRTA